MRSFDKKMFTSLKKSFRDVIRHIERVSEISEIDDFDLPVIVMNWYEHQALYFQNEQTAVKYVQAVIEEWDEIHDEDKGLEVITFSTDFSKEISAHSYGHHEFFREIRNIKFFRGRRNVRFEKIIEYYPVF